MRRWIFCDQKQLRGQHTVVFTVITSGFFFFSSFIFFSSPVLFVGFVFRPLTHIVTKRQSHLVPETRLGSRRASTGGHIDKWGKKETGCTHSTGWMGGGQDGGGWGRGRGRTTLSHDAYSRSHHAARWACNKREVSVSASSTQSKHLESQSVALLRDWRAALLSGTWLRNFRSTVREMRLQTQTYRRGGSYHGHKWPRGRPASVTQQQSDEAAVRGRRIVSALSFITVVIRVIIVAQAENKLEYRQQGCQRRLHIIYSSVLVGLV